ncbi:MAG TPA: metal-dependent transcriptional regulator [Candidatus Dormibacteraeota bacterium]|nr:metal-dependent transcriptional regulator [Candidatus Dormibacteraeota bacterium]
MDVNVKASSEEKLTRARQDYLKALYHLGGGAGNVSTTQLAERLAVAPASVTEMLATLRTLDLVIYDRYRGASLTRQGVAAALQTIRRHRLIELFLVEMLGYSWDEVHDEAERMEHVISRRMEERIFEALGRPDLDPHGDPIPSASGKIAREVYRTLAETQTGEQVTIRRVSDRDPRKLRVMRELDLRPGRTVEVLAGSLYESPIEIAVGRRRRQVPLGIAREVFVD